VTGTASGDWRDATRSLPHGHPVWPGDTPFELVRTARLEDGDSVNLMRTSGTTHLGTHLDAPWHVDGDGARVESVPLSVLIGPGLVVDVRGGAGPVRAAELPDGALPGRVLLRTGQPDVWTSFPDGIRPLSVEAVRHLAERGARLVGTDAPSVDELDSRELPVHHACNHAGVAIVESLALTNVPDGPCEVVCLPLKLVGADAAPVRVVVRPAPEAP
jgi:arylformamidase